MLSHSVPQDDKVAADFKLNCWSGIFVSTLVSVILIAVIYFMPATHSEYRDLAGNSMPLILQERGLGIFYLGWLFCLGVIFFGIYSCHIGIRGFRRPSMDKVIFKFFGFFMVASIVLLIAGYHAGNGYWADYFSTHGYSRCANSFLMTGNWGQDVWVDSPGLCNNSGVIDRLKSHKSSLADVNAYVVGLR